MLVIFDYGLIFRNINQIILIRDKHLRLPGDDFNLSGRFCGLAPFYAGLMHRHEPDAQTAATITVVVIPLELLIV